MVKKNVLIIADLGAAGNLCRNLLLANQCFDWPLQQDRLQSIQAQYTSDIELNQWLVFEYRLRFFQTHYDVDLSNDLDWEKYRLSLRTRDKPAVFLNHSAFWQPEQLALFSSHVETMYISPESDFGLRWQIRSYVEKKNIELLHDFCFMEDRQQQKEQYIRENGVESYYRSNITNMYHIVRQRQMNLKSSVGSHRHIPLECFISNRGDVFREKIKSILSIDLDPATTDDLLTRWLSLHWPAAETDNWKYHDCFA
jgi:hypothetical protein